MAARMLGLLAAANAVAVVALWVHGGGPHDDFLTSAGRLTGLLGAYLSLVELLVLARGPRSSAWHRWAGHAVLWLLVAHTVFITWGYTSADGTSLVEQARRLIEEFPGVITATAGLIILIVVVIATALRRRLRYETWYFIHLYTYLAIALAFSHQLATGTEFVGDPLARTYWYALYGVTLAGVLWRLVGVRRLRVERVVEAAPGVVHVEMSGPVRARPGQFFRWRFLTRGRWFEAHPFSLSAARRVRITVKGVGDHSRGLRELRPGTRVLAEGPYGGFTSRRRKTALIAGGVGITPIRALLEEIGGDVVVVHRGEAILRDELDALAAERGFVIHYAAGDRLLALVPDVTERDVYVCGPPEMVDATVATLRDAGVERIVTERFAL
jgi:predicted ferric reductase